MLLHHQLESIAATHPEGVALEDATGAQLTFRQLDALAVRLAVTLQSAGVQPGDRVAVMLGNEPEFAVAIFAAMKLGAVFVPLARDLKAPKLAYVLADCTPAAIVVDARLANQVAAPIQQAPSLRIVLTRHGTLDDPRAQPFESALGVAVPLPRWPVIDLDLVSIIYTSGSTGDPTGVMLTHRNMVSACNSVSEYLGYRAGDVIVSALPLSFDYGLYQVLMGARTGATVVLLTSFAYPAQVLDLMQRRRATVFPAVPTMVSLLMGLDSLAGWDLTSLRLVTNTAAALSERQIQWLRTTFGTATLFSMYGLTECKRVTFLPPDELDRRPLSVGRGMPNEEVWLIDDAGKRLPNGSTGQLVVRGSNVFIGYWNKPEATAERLRAGESGTERWLFTGDTFRTDADGFLYFVCRNDDIIKSRGEKVAPREVEGRLCDHEDVVAAAVVGVPDPVLGEAVKAYVVLRPGAQVVERELIRFAQARLESYMVPKIVEIVAELPTTSTGKVARRTLRDAQGTSESS